MSERKRKSVHFSTGDEDGIHIPEDPHAHVRPDPMNTPTLPTLSEPPTLTDIHVYASRGDVEGVRCLYEQDDRVLMQTQYFVDSELVCILF